MILLTTNSTRLYPLSNMMGGSRIKKNIVGENASILLVSCSGRVIMIMPTTAPRNTVNKIFK